MSIDWHPKRKSWLAAATSMNWKFEERVDHAGRAVRSHILVYNFSEFSSQVPPAHHRWAEHHTMTHLNTTCTLAQIVLEAPHEVLTFRWNPTNPNFIAAGCITGQVLLFDLTAAQDLFTRNSKRKGETSESDKALRIKPCSVSSIDQSHRRPVQQLEWLPPSVEVTTQRKPHCPMRGLV